MRGWTLVAVHEEIDVSGGMPLDRRHGLRSAVEAVERGEARVVGAAYVDSGRGLGRIRLELLVQ